MTLPIAEFERYKTKDTIEAAIPRTPVLDATIVWRSDDEDDPDPPEDDCANHLAFAFHTDDPTRPERRTETYARNRVPPAASMPARDGSDDAEETEAGEAADSDKSGASSEDEKSSVAASEERGNESEDSMDAAVRKGLVNQVQRDGRNSRASVRNKERDRLEQRELPPNPLPAVILQKKIETTRPPSSRPSGSGKTKGGRKRKAGVDTTVRDKRKVLVDSVTHENDY